VDLIEEIARHYAYDRLPSRVRPAPPRVEVDTRREKELTLSRMLVGLGYRQIITSSMVDAEENARFTARPPVQLANPLSQEASALRSSPFPSMLHALRWNLDRNQVDVRFFEIGQTYTASPGGTGGLPEERRVLTLGLTGHRRPDSVHDSGKQLDFFDLKGDLETLWGAFDIPGLRFEPVGCHYYEKGLAGRFLDQSGDLAILGQLSREIASEYKVRQALWLAEVHIYRLFAWPRRMRKYRLYSKFPAVERDFSLVVPEGVTYSQVEGSLTGVVAVIQSVRPVELFRGGQVPPHHYSLLLRITFQDFERTLTSEEIAEASQQLLRAIEPLGVRLRS
jgi:phenylalanyl-tRNA synthetase beta chain